MYFIFEGDVMTKNNDGGGAFPLHEDSTAAMYMAQRGMTLRDYFAAHAPEIDNTNVLKRMPMDGDSSDYLKIIAEWNYEYADAMIAERNKDD